MAKRKFDTAMIPALHLESLPIEIIDKILSKLSWNELRNVLLVNKNLNSIISNSYKLLEIVRFNYCERSMSSTRSYSRFLLMICKKASIEHFNASFKHHNIKEIRLDNFFPQKKSTVSELFQICKNLKRLEVIGSLQLRPVQKDDDEELVKPTLKLDYLNVDYENLDFFNKCSVKRLCIKNMFYKHGQSVLQQFLKTQKCLETLEVSSFEELINYESTFKLKTLILKDEYYNNTIKARAFFMVHKDTLRNVIIYGSAVSNYLIALSDHPAFSIKLNLSAPINNPEQLPIMRNVKELEITGCLGTKLDYQAFDGKFPNLTKLRLVNFKSLKPLFSFNQLEELSIENSIMRGALQIPNVKKVEFINTIFQMIPNPFNFNNNKVEEVFLNFCLYTGWFNSFIQHNDTQLRLVTIWPSVFCNIKGSVVEANSHKIKELRILNCSMLKN